MGHQRLFLLSLVLVLATTHAGGGHAQAAAVTQQGVGVGSMMRSMVGSRPPSCAGRCWWCGGRRCEAVQVPVTPQELQRRINKKKGGHGRTRGGSLHPSLQKPSSYEDHSNYKPLSWRCKCGAVVLNP